MTKNENESGTADRRTVFFASDHTGITVESLGRGLLAQFEGIPFEEVTLPFVDSETKARQVVERINQAAAHDDARPLVFATLVDPVLRARIATADAFFIDLFESFVPILEQELGTAALRTIGRTHSVSNMASYQRRMEAVNYALAHDDGVTVKNYEYADIILVGVSRVGKTPTCLYLALQHGVRAANFPLTPDDFAAAQLPPPLLPYLTKLYGLTIQPERLSRIRQERRPDSDYASLAACRRETRQAASLFHNHRIPYLDTTTLSVEEISTTLLQEAKLSRCA